MVNLEMNQLMRYKWSSHSIWTFYLELNSNFFNFKVIVVNIYIDLEFNGINYWFNQMQLPIPALFSAWCIWYAAYFIDNMMEHRCKIEILFYKFVVKSDLKKVLLLLCLIFVAEIVGDILFKIAWPAACIISTRDLCW